MTLVLKPYYPAAPAAIRAVAFDTDASAKQVKAVMGKVAAEHRKAVAETGGILTNPLVDHINFPAGAQDDVVRHALWAALQMERFADAIEVYNTDSQDPWSIRTINNVIQNGNSSNYGLGETPDPGEDGYATWGEDLAAARAHLNATVERHYQRLEANLDDAAAQVAAALHRGPTDAAIKQAWKAGNLPTWAALVWPDLQLRALPIKGVPPGLRGLSPKQVIARIKDMSHPLSDAELEWMHINYPAAMQKFSQNWTLSPAYYMPPSKAPAGMTPTEAMCTAEGNVQPGKGWILGPDGHVYEIRVPTQPAPTGQPTIGNPYGSLFSDIGGWHSLGHRQGSVYIGEPPASGLNIFNGATGSVPSLHGYQSIGENQTDFLTYGEDGALTVHEEVPAPPDEWSPQTTSAPYTPGTMPSRPTLGGAVGSSYAHRVAAAESLAAGLPMINGALKGAVLNNQIDANNSFAANVVFQENADGVRRAVIQVSQVAASDEGDVKVLRYYGAVDDNGELVRDGFQDKND